MADIQDEKLHIVTGYYSMSDLTEFMWQLHNEIIVLKDVEIAELKDEINK